MRETIVETEAVEEPVAVPAVEAVSDDQSIRMPIDPARLGGLQLTGAGGLLQQLTKRVLECAPTGEITDHLGYDKQDVEGRGSGNSPVGTRVKTAPTDVGPVERSQPGSGLREPCTKVPTSWPPRVQATPNTSPRPSRPAGPQTVGSATGFHTAAGGRGHGPGLPPATRGAGYR